MVDYAGDSTLGLDAATNRHTIAAVAFQPDRPADVASLRVLHDVDPDGGSWEATGEGSRSTSVADFAGHCEPDPGQHWFEKVWAQPQRIELGNILTTITRAIEIYNAYRNESRTLSAAANNAGDGISFSGLPGLPATIQLQAGELFDVVVTTSGPPDVDGTLDFTLDVVSLSIPITGTRVVMFPFEPEENILEVLEFRTDILTAINGDEQRASIRKHPRQIIQMRVRTEDSDNERRRLNNLLFAWHAGVFGLPIWFEARSLDVDASAGATTIYCDTSYGDFRVGSLLIVWKDSETFDAVEIDTINDDNIVLSSALVNGYDAVETLVMPLRVAYSDQEIDGRQWLNELEEVGFKFRVIDNEADLADTTAFSSHNSKVMFDDPNLVSRNQLQQSLRTQLTRFDNQSAGLLQLSEWAVSQYSSRKGFLARTLQEVWQVRQVVHALRGSQVSFYLSTFRKDLNVTQALASGSFDMDIEHCDYTSYVNAQDPNASILIELTDGTKITREVQSATELSATEERLVVDTAWGSTISVAEIARVSYLRLCRIANDQVSFQHSRPGQADVSMNVVGVTQ